MAITDNSFTAAEIGAALTANPALLKEVQTAFTPLGHHAIAKDEYNAFLERERGTLAGGITSKIYNQIDEDVKAVSGVDKTDPQEKTYDYLKRAISHLKGGSDTLQKEISDLKEKIAKGDGNQALKDQLAALQAQSKKFQEEVEPGYKQQLFKKDVQLQYELGMRGIKLKSDVPESIMKPFLKTIQEQLITMSKADANGNIYYVDKDGKAILDGVNPASSEYVLKSLLGDLVDTGKQQSGGGSQQPTGGRKSGVKNADGVEIEVPDNLGSQEELTDYLLKQGLASHTKEHVDLFQKFNVGKDGKPLPLRKR